MAKGKRESIVPGLGKKQAAVLNNEAGRQAEHKRHLDELGFPEYVEPDFVRHAPVSYDDPSNPSPSRVVNQAGQDLGATNDPLLSKSLAEMVDVQAIVKEAASEVFLTKDVPTTLKDLLGDEYGEDGDQLAEFADNNNNIFSQGWRAIKDVVGDIKQQLVDVGAAEEIWEKYYNQKGVPPALAKTLSYLSVVASPESAARGQGFGENIFDLRAALPAYDAPAGVQQRSEREQRLLKIALDTEMRKNKRARNGVDMANYFAFLYTPEYVPTLVEMEEFFEDYGRTGRFIDSDQQGWLAAAAENAQKKLYSAGAKIEGKGSAAKMTPEMYKVFITDHAKFVFDSSQRANGAGEMPASDSYYAAQQELAARNKLIQDELDISKVEGGLSDEAKAADDVNTLALLNDATSEQDNIVKKYYESQGGIFNLFNRAKEATVDGVSSAIDFGEDQYKKGKEFFDGNVVGDESKVINAWEKFTEGIKGVFDKPESLTPESTAQEIGSKLTAAGYGRGISEQGVQTLASQLEQANIPKVDIGRVTDNIIDNLKSSKVNTSGAYEAFQNNIKDILTNAGAASAAATTGPVAGTMAARGMVEDPTGAGLAPPPQSTSKDSQPPVRSTQTDLRTDPGKQSLGRTQAELDVIARNKAAKDQALKTRDPKALERFGMAPVGTKAIHKYNAWLQKAEEEGAMAKVQLDRVSDLADMLHDILEDEDELPGWIQNKISDSLHNLEASFTNLAYDEKEELGLRKTIDTFKDFLAQAPSQGGFLKKNAGLLLRALRGALKAGKAGGTATLTGARAGAGPAGAATVGGAQAFIDEIKDNALVLGLNLTTSQKKQEDNMRQLLAIESVGGQQVYDNLTSAQKQKAQDKFDAEFITNVVNVSKEIIKDRDYIIRPENKELVDSLTEQLDKLAIEPTDASGVPISQTQGGQSKDRGGADSKTGDMGVPDFVQPTSTIKPVGVREATVSELAARDEAGYRGTSTNPFELPVVGNEEKNTANKLDKFVSALESNLNIAPDLQRAAALKNVKPLPKVASGVGYMKDGKSYDEFGRRTTAPVESALREITIVDDKGKKGTSVVSDAQIIPGSYDPAVVRDVFGGSKSAANSYFGIQAAIIKELVNDFIQKAKKKKGGRKKDPRLARAGVAGFNKPKRTPKHPKKSHIVVAKEGDKIKTIRFGEQGAKTAGDRKKGESAKMRKKRKSFKARHRKNIKRGKMSAAYWADRVKW